MAQKVGFHLARGFVKPKELVRGVRSYFAGGLFGLQVLLFQLAMAAPGGGGKTGGGGGGNADPTAGFATTAFDSLTTAICAIVNTLKGPFGLALVVIMFAIGAISLMIGGRRAIPIMITAAVGGVILSAAPSFAQIFMANVNMPKACQTNQTKK